MKKLGVLIPPIKVGVKQTPPYQYPPIPRLGFAQKKLHENGGGILALGVRARAWVLCVLLPGWSRVAGVGLFGWLVVLGVAVVGAGCQG